MEKIMSIQEYQKLTDSDKSEIERLLFDVLKEEMENRFPFINVEKVDFNDYWKRLDEDAERWSRLSGFVLSNGKTYIRLPDFDDYIKNGDKDVSYSKTLYDIQENIFEFFRLPNAVMGATLAWGNDDYEY
jgi:hypothetical protein